MCSDVIYEWCSLCWLIDLEKQDNLLTAAVRKFNGKNWKKIGEHRLFVSCFL